MRAGRIFATVSDDGTKVAVSDLVSFSAFKDGGDWKLGGAFTADDLKDNFNPVLDEAEARRLLNEAKAALSL